MKLTDEIKQSLESDGYFELKESNGFILGLMKFAFTLAIVVDIHNDGSYEHRFCYPYGKALECLMAYKLYEGIDDPQGSWIKNKGWNVDRLNPAIAHLHIN
jgi:hypothetical protein